jgi:hypothetical protein
MATIRHMRGKKLLTVGCAVGILAWGACFDPPPRIRLNLQGSRRIVVRVTNTTETRHIDPAVLGPCIAHAVNSDLRGKATAVVGGEPGPEDIVLNVTISKEEAQPDPFDKKPNVTRWVFNVTLSASLNRSDGTVLRTYANRYFGLTSGTALGGPWDPAPLAKALPTTICERLADELVYTGP